ncbi:hypothetical protein ACFLSJ_06410 [Verrucomicrobiota bacterium]
MRLKALICVLLAAACAGPATAQDREMAERVRTGVDVWPTTGSGEWEVSIDSGFGYEGRSMLEWDDTDAVVWVLHGDVFIYPWLYVSGEYGFGTIEDASNRDTDYVNGFLYSESISSTEGDMRMYDASVHADFTSMLALEGFDGQFDVFVGYQYYTDELEDSDGIQTMMYDMPMYYSLAEGVNATYDFEWQGVRVGVHGEYSFTRELSASAELAIIAGVQYEGEAFWALRDDYRSTPPNFVHEADNGSGVDVSVFVSYFPWENMGFRGGYRSLTWDAEDGTDTTYFADGSALETPLDSVESTRQGFFVGLVGRI